MVSHELNFALLREEVRFGRGATKRFVHIYFVNFSIKSIFNYINSLFPLHKCLHDFYFNFGETEQEVQKRRPSTYSIWRCFVITWITNSTNSGYFRVIELDFRKRFPNMGIWAFCLQKPQYIALLLERWVGLHPYSHINITRSAKHNAPPQIGGLIGCLVPPHFRGQTHATLFRIASP